MLVVALPLGGLGSGLCSCSDDHFDITSEAAGKHTIWQQIQANENQLSEYADILQRVYYSQTEEKTTPETYADLLNGEQMLTVWAPVNGSFNYNYYKGLLETGVRDSIYKVEKELIRNNLARYSRVVNGSDSIRLELFNNKAVWLNYEKHTIKGVTIDAPNVGASNGVLHITSSPVPYQPNLYEYLATREDLDSINTFIKGFQTTEFNKNASTQGPTVNGRATWVDSVTYLANNYTRDFMHAYLNAEDSDYVMIIPTNEAWKEVLEKTSKYFNYKSQYELQMHGKSAAGKDSVYTEKETFEQYELDSIRNLYAKNAICQHLVFNANWPASPRAGRFSSLEGIRELDETGDSLISTAGRKFKKTGTLNRTNGTNVVEVNKFTDLFGNREPVEVSNGHAYVVDNYAYPFKTFAPDIDELNLMASETNCDAAYSTKEYDKEKVTIGDEIIQTDSVYRYRCLVMKNHLPSSHPSAYFKLTDVLSGKYDIYVVLNYNTDKKMPNKFSVGIAYDGSNGKRVNNEQLKNPDEGAVDYSGKKIGGTRYFVNRGIHYNTQGEVDYTDTICVAKDFVFPFSYYGLTKACPVINIKSYFTSSDAQYYCREIWVNSIILKSKEE